MNECLFHPRLIQVIFGFENNKVISESLHERR